MEHGMSWASSVPTKGGRTIRQPTGALPRRRDERQGLGRVFGGNQSGCRVMYSRMGADRGEGAGRVGGALCRTGRRALCEQVYGRGCSYWYRGAAGGAVLGPAELLSCEESAGICTSAPRRVRLVATGPPAHTWRAAKGLGPCTSGVRPLTGWLAAPGRTCSSHRA